MVDIPTTGRRTSRTQMPIHDAVAGAAALLENLAYSFKNRQLVEEALTHPSWRNEHPECLFDNQRMEFLGDAVLGLAITEALVDQLPQRGEGQLTVLKSQLVRESMLANMAQSLGIGPALRLGRGEDLSGGRQRASILADAMEAVLGAVFCDGGYLAAQALVRILFGELLLDASLTVEELGALPTALSAGTANWKTAVQELLQRAGHLPPTYSVVSDEGPEHAPTFRITACATIGNTILQGQGEGSTKKAAEFSAAEALYTQMVTNAWAMTPELAALVQAPVTRPSGLRARPVGLAAPQSAAHPAKDNGGDSAQGDGGDSAQGDGSSGESGPESSIAVQEPLA